jgi:hypothetical protein
MSRFQKHVCLFPDDKALVQDYVEKSEHKLIPVCKDIAFFHFTRTALIAEKDKDEKKYRRRVVKIGVDPHTSYANMLCDVAWSRAHGTTTFMLPDIAATGFEPLAPEDIGIPHDLSAVMNEIQSAQYTGDVCGRCANYDPAKRGCREINMLVNPKDPGCAAFISQ